MTKYGYGRVSTLGQELEVQVEALLNEGVLEENLFSEKFTGTKTDRPEFNKVLALLKESDTLVITKLDRFARTVSEGIAVIKDLFERGIKVHVLNMGLIENTPTGRLIFNIMCSFAEFERDMIIERTSSGKLYAKENNPDFKEGRPATYKRKQIETALELLEKHSYKEVEEMTGISKSTLQRAKRKQKANTILKTYS